MLLIYMMNMGKLRSHVCILMGSGGIMVLHRVINSFSYVPYRGNLDDYVALDAYLAHVDELINFLVTKYDV